MSPEYRVEIIVPYTYIVDAENEDKAEEKAWDLFEDGDQGIDPFRVEVASVEEIRGGSTVKGDDNSSPIRETEASGDQWNG